MGRYIDKQTYIYKEHTHIIILVAFPRISVPNPTATRSGSQWRCPAARGGVRFEHWTCGVAGSRPKPCVTGHPGSPVASKDPCIHVAIGNGHRNS
jgi:hypothetical protein